MKKNKEKKKGKKLRKRKKKTEIRKQKNIFILLYFYFILFVGTRINVSLFNTYPPMMNVTQWEGLPNIQRYKPVNSGCWRIQ